MTIDKIFIGEAARSGGTQDGGTGSGNWGHKGRPGMRGGSGKGGHGEGKNNAQYYSRERRRYSLNNSNAGKSSQQSWGYKAKPTKNLPKGSGTFKISRADIGGGQNSIVPYLRADGSLTPDRQKLHDRAINQLFSNKNGMVPKAGEQKTFYFLGGGAASGKGSLTNPDTCAHYNMVSNADVPTIDADEFKKKLPEYSTQIRQTERAAAFAHEESSALTKRAQQAAFENGYNCVLDGTGDGSVEKVLSKIKQARDAGYKVEARYVTAPIEEAIDRSLDRMEKTGRYVPLDTLIGIHKNVSSIFPQVASEFDHVELYDTNQGKGVPGKKIAECWRGQPIKVYDQKLYDAFLAKNKFVNQGADYYRKKWEEKKATEKAAKKAAKKK